MKNKLVYILLPLVLLACNKDEKDTQAPEVIIVNPIANVIYKSGDTVFIKGTVTDEELHELNIQVTKENDTLVLFTANPMVHEKQSYNMNEMWVVPALKDSMAVILSVEAHDHHEHSTKENVKYFIKP